MIRLDSIQVSSPIGQTPNNPIHNSSFITLDSLAATINNGTYPLDPHLLNQPELQPKDWLFFIPEEESNSIILYAPVHKFAIRIPAEAQPIIEQIIQGGKPEGEWARRIEKIINIYKLMDFPDSWKPESIMKQASGHKITMSITNKCNLRCVYCYAETGLDFTTMPWDVAQNAIESLIYETILAGDKDCSITFHGGGEAFVEFDLLQKCVEYARLRAKEEGLKVTFSAVTNATLITLERANWVKETGFTHLTVSLDSVKECHDKQRPHSNNSGSFDSVMKGIGNISKANINFSIRSTITDFSVLQMADFVKMVAHEIFPKRGTIHFEAMSFCGRAENSVDQLVTDPEMYLANYLEAKKVGEELGINVTCSMDSFKKEKKRYCGTSYATMACHSPNGMVSACSRVTKLHDTGADLFFYASYDSNQQKFIIDNEKRNKIISHGILPSSCTTCYARWNCQGDCPISRLAYGEHHNITCDTTRKLLKLSIINALNETQQNERELWLESIYWGKKIFDINEKNDDNSNDCKKDCGCDNDCPKDCICDNDCRTDCSKDCGCDNDCESDCSWDKDGTYKK